MYGEVVSSTGALEIDSVIHGGEETTQHEASMRNIIALAEEIVSAIVGSVLRNDYIVTGTGANHPNWTLR